MFSAEAKTILTTVSAEYPTLQSLIEQVLSQDPRPAYKQKTFDEKLYGMALYEFNIQWQMIDLKTLYVISISKAVANSS